MNNTLDPSKIQEYLGELPLDQERQQALAQQLEEQGGDLATLHRALHEDDLAAAEPLEETREMLDSVPARLTLGWPDALERGCRIVQDHQGRPTIDSTPPITRTRMVPEPWQINILDRGWRRLKGEKPSPRPRTRESEDFAEERWRHVAAVRRTALLVLMITQTVVATWYMKSVLPYQGWSLVDLGLVFEQPWQESARQILPYVVQTSILALFALLFCWVSMGFWTALMGFFQLLKGRDRYSISASSCGDEPISPRARTALVMPIANEHVPRVFAGLRATFESLKATGQLEHFDFFVLSDSNDPDICVAEQQAWMELCREVEGFGHIFYRRRRRRVKRKSGNIDDFCRRWGSNYRYMVVLDADSVMSGECLTRLVRLMEANPGAGIIQTAPKASGMDTLYARLQQFATSVYGPLFTAGLNFWQLGESHYWGHNAIIRVKPFIEHCALAPLPGTGSFAGAILSHDFVEAALMRRAGWGVWIAYDLPGSYEELPPNLLDELKRDRRWCHGNLMNFRLFLVRGMHAVHRVVFLTGVMSYLSAPLWLLFLVLSTSLLAIHTLMVPEYFLQPNQLYPLWPRWQPEEAVALFSATMTLLFLPKLLSVLLIWIKGAEAYGGRTRVLLSMLLEASCSVLLAPVRMLFHSLFVTAAFLGWSVQWNSPQRVDDSTPWSEAFRRHGTQVLIGISWTALVAWLNPDFLWWLAPIVVSLVLSPVVSVLTSRTAPGLAARRSKLFLIPEEHKVPRELSNTSEYEQLNSSRALHKGFLRAVVDPLYNALVCAMARARHAKVVPAAEALRDERIEEILNAGPEGQVEATRWRLLNDPDGMARLHARIWQEPQYHAWREALRDA
ncbi:glucans biosynthesis glucosyltransferase MdoH [Ectopseudomonas composti]|jgi:membrane glycosyltransferase|uniref:Glucans biosynthesis glucosyltransferase H n=1 Tax=Ectopseudomonas composti TaxID=658457 RepID=A0A1I5M0I8_9GAMM|nr:MULTISPECIES: glucans biosynthesis glucosyltransferase MdoH [Pseudomonas]EZH78811.1 glucosyltransferase MdoH [Pseudomonas composti]QNH08123.1 glucans biosynthesis glucosyltransferase MdoH [Pseudomonas sp. B11D7D]SFP02536.1 membrane glycosyltransferase [Pseudomonas composti]